MSRTVDVYMDRSGQVTERHPPIDSGGYPRALPRPNDPHRGRYLVVYSGMGAPTYLWLTREELELERLPTSRG